MRKSRLLGAASSVSVLYIDFADDGPVDPADLPAQFRRQYFRV